MKTAGVPANAGRFFMRSDSGRRQRQVSVRRVDEGMPHLQVDRADKEVE
jgi:type IV secretory pathway VirD2 relaxase